jgi:hypothetical protein
MNDIKVKSSDLKVQSLLCLQKHCPSESSVVPWPVTRLLSKKNTCDWYGP